MSYRDPEDPRIRASHKKYYLKNKERHIRNKERVNSEMNAFVNELKSAPCMDCNMLYPYWVMDFDHRDGEVKFKNVSILVKSGNWKRLKNEVAKCDVVCSNCHRTRTYNRRKVTVGA